MPGHNPVWVDCDPGHDDAFAMALAAQHPDFNLLGISTIHGNASLEATTDNALSVLTALNRTAVPVYPGVKKPFCRPPTHCGPPRKSTPGKTGIDGADDLPKPATGPQTDKHAVIAMRDTLLAQPKGTAWLVLLDSFTNIALLMTLFPAVADHIKGLTIMGGAIGGGHTNAPTSQMKPGETDRIGNATLWAEFNAYCDPESSRAIFSNPILAKKTTLLPLDVTHLALIEDYVIDLMLNGPPGIGTTTAPSKTRVIFTDLLKFFRAVYRKAQNLDGPLHDPLAVAAILDQEGVEDIGFDYRDGERFAIEFVLEGEQVGRTIATPLPPGSEGVRIPRGLNVPEFWRVVERALAANEEGR
ncbi:Inosine/uridine-preferring nucleoside hydrolase domain-containing protein [Aspergillus californicus]